MSLKYLIIGTLPKIICDEKRFNVNIQKLTRKNKGSESETETAVKTDNLMGSVLYLKLYIMIIDHVK